MLNLFRVVIGVLLIYGLVGCTSTMRPSSVTRATNDSGPDEDQDVSGIQDAIPQNVDITNAGNRTPYTVLGKTYNVNFKTTGYSETGLASWYGRKFHGCKTSNGETYDMFGMTAAHKTLAIPAYVRVTNLENQKTVVVKVNDRGPFHDDRIIDLSYAAAKKLDCHRQGTAKVKIEVLAPEQTQLAVSEPVKVTDLDPVADVAQPSSPQQTYLQAGAFTQKENAVDLQRQLHDLTGHEVKIRAEPSKKVFKVLIGPILDNLQLASLRQKLQDAQIFAPFPVKF